MKRVGLVIGTLGSVPYVHLHLEQAKRLCFPIMPILVHDDCSGQEAELKALCAGYGAQFASSPFPLGHGAGDVAALTQGIHWARAQGMDWLVKMSRRFIPLRDWLPSLEQAIDARFYPTYSRKTRWLAEPELSALRTECIAFQPDSWARSGVVNYLESLTRSHDMTDIEVKICRAALGVYEYAIDDHRNQRPFYGTWDWLDSDNNAVTDRYLWHYGRGPEDYANLAQSLGLPYVAADFDAVLHPASPTFPRMEKKGF